MVRIPRIVVQVQLKEMRGQGFHPSMNRDPCIDGVMPRVQAKPYSPRSKVPQKDLHFPGFGLIDILEREDCALFPHRRSHPGPKLQTPIDPFFPHKSVPSPIVSGMHHDASGSENGNGPEELFASASCHPPDRGIGGTRRQIREWTVQGYPAFPGVQPGRNRLEIGSIASVQDLGIEADLRVEPVVDKTRKIVLLQHSKGNIDLDLFDDPPHEFFPFHVSIPIDNPRDFL